MKTCLSEKMNAIYPIGKILESFEKKMTLEKSRFQAELNISKFLTFLVFETRFCLQMALKKFYALFDHDVGLKSNLKVQGYLKHVESSAYDALNAS